MYLGIRQVFMEAALCSSALTPVTVQHMLLFAL